MTVNCAELASTHAIAGREFVQAMSVSIAEVRRMVEEQISQIDDPKLADVISRLLIPPHCETREWDYGVPGETIPSWIVLEHPESNTAIAYCENGFGPKNPWGLLFLTGIYTSLGMDSDWYSSLCEAALDSGFWDDIVNV